MRMPRATQGWKGCRKPGSSAAGACNQPCVAGRGVYSLPKHVQFHAQAAVPKFMQLRLDPASGNMLGASSGSTAMQNLHVTNTMHGQKPLVMRLRIAYTRAGKAKLEQSEVKNFPPGL